MKKRFHLTLFLLAFCGICIGQQTISTAGGEASGTGSTVSFTIGQIAYTSVDGNDGSVSEGVQHPYEIFDIKDNLNIPGIDLELSVYPNPVRDYLLLKAKDFTSSNLAYRLYDSEGKLLESKTLSNDETYIPIDMLVPSVYYLRISENLIEVKTFKIIKY